MNNPFNFYLCAVLSCNNFLYRVKDFLEKINKLELSSFWPELFEKVSHLPPFNNRVIFPWGDMWQLPTDDVLKLNSICLAHVANFQKVTCLILMYNVTIKIWTYCILHHFYLYLLNYICLWLSQQWTPSSPRRLRGSSLITINLPWKDLLLRRNE